jgi:UDP-N-acetylglucosamine 1-carboxyvinyltransferase
MSRLIIRGGKTLAGELAVAGNKNAALPMLAACLLTDQTVTLRRVPDIQDVRVMCSLLRDLGAEVAVQGDVVTVRAHSVDPSRLSADRCRQIRGSILLAGPLLARCGSAVLTAPGGDVIGRRRLDTHLHGLGDMGAELVLEGNGLILRAAKGLRATDLLLDEASVTATENLVMAAAATPGRTLLYNAACEPHVQDVCHLLVDMGARIEGIGTNRLVIEGRNHLQGADRTLGPDYIEAGSYLAAAALTGGEVTLRGAHDEGVYRVVRRGFERLGLSWQVRGDDWIHVPGRELVIADDLGGAIPKLEDGIWPAFPSDLMSILLVLATQARGSVLFFEKLFESRMVWVDRLVGMGARIVQCDPHRVLVTGPSPLFGSHQTSPDIRAGMALILAALCAKGESVIENAQMIDRGYERVDERLRQLGADVRRED